jgi:hypothetical protein
MVCTVLKYVSLQKRYLKLLIKFGTDFEVRQKRKTVPFRFTLGTNNFEMIPYFHVHTRFPKRPEQKSFACLCIVIPRDGYLQTANSRGFKVHQ